MLSRGILGFVGASYDGPVDLVMSAVTLGSPSERRDRRSFGLSDGYPKATASQMEDLLLEFVLENFMHSVCVLLKLHTPGIANRHVREYCSSSTSGGDPMESAATELRGLIAGATPRLRSLPEDRASGKPVADKWSLKEILGHLIDSASNNHQRFVRMQLQQDIGVFSYQQGEWNAVQKYQLERWQDLVDLWAFYNTHLVHLMEHVDPASLGHTCDMGYPSPATLKFVMEDYVRHVRHHLDQILGDMDPQKRTRWVRRDPKEQ